MPGWGAALQKGFNYVGGAAGFGAAAAASRGGFRGAAARYGLQGIGMFASAAGRSPTAAMTAGGMMAGGAWGAISGDTSVLGGMMMGAGLGRYGFAAARGARQGARYGIPGAGATGVGGRAWAGMRGAGRGAFRTMRADANRARGFIGSRLNGNSAPNAVKGLQTPAPIDFGRFDPMGVTTPRMAGAVTTRQTMNKMGWKAAGPTGSRVAANRRARGLGYYGT